MLLENGVDTWHGWRKKKPAILLNLIRARLPKVNLMGANLTRARLTKASRMTLGQSRTFCDMPPSWGSYAEL
jgi:hypothetical protein